jgi:hypothetical protein
MMQEIYKYYLNIFGIITFFLLRNKDGGEIVLRILNQILNAWL